MLVKSFEILCSSPQIPAFGLTCRFPTASSKSPIQETETETEVVSPVDAPVDIGTASAPIVGVVVGFGH